MTTTPQPFCIGERNLPNPENHVNPARPDNLLGAAQVIAADGPTVIGTYASFDGGRTWQDNGPLPYPPGSRGAAPWASA